MKDIKKTSTSKSQSKTEIALKESEQRYRTTMMSVGDGVIATDTEGRIEMINPVAEELTGWKQKEALGKSLEEIFHIINEETRQSVENPVRRVMRKGIVVDLANHSLLIAKDGTEHPIADSAAPIRNEKEEITGVVLVFRDQTRERIAQKALEESREKYYYLYENSPVGMYHTKIDGSMVLEINNSACEMLGLAKEEILGQPSSMRWANPNRRNEILKILKEYGVAINFDAEILKKDGSTLSCLLSMKIFKEKGYIEGFMIDISDRKLAEEHLRKLNRIYSLLSDINQAIVRTRVPKELFEKVCNIAVGQGGFGMAWIGLIDDSSQKLQVIAQAGRTTGYHEQINITLNGESLSYCPIVSALRQGKHNICNIIENEEMATCQKIAYELGFRSSASFPLKVSDILKGALTFYSDEPEFFDEAELKLLDELAMDISFAMEFAEKEAGHKLAEKALQESENKFKYVFDHSVIGKSITLPSGEIHVNKAFCDMLGYSWEELEETKWQDISHPEDNELTQKMINSLISGEKDSVRFIKRYLHKNGAVVWTDVGTALRRDYDGKPLYFMTAINNITDRKLAEEEIRKLNAELEGRVVMRTAQLEASNKELEAFSYSVSHDLRAPLRHVSGYVELLNKRFQSELPEKGQHYLNSIADSVRIMGMLIDDLLQFSRTGRTEMHQSDLDMNEIVKEVKESLCKDNPDRKIEWVLGKLPSVNGDEAMLKLVWTNLLSNAVKFTRTRKKARIEIGVSKENKELVLFVRDNGVGFDMQYAQKLFGVFQRLHPTEEFEGTGIGLANVHRIVLRHGGRTWAEAEPDKGAVFYFSIPNK